jgi:hypothetical protein
LALPVPDENEFGQAMLNCRDVSIHVDAHVAPELLVQETPATERADLAIFVGIAILSGGKQSLQFTVNFIAG